MNQKKQGFTLLEVLVAMAMISITLMVVLDAMSTSLSRASEAKFNTTAPLLVQRKVAEMEMVEADDLRSGSGDFEDEFPGYSWNITVDQPFLNGNEGVAEHIKQIDLTVTWGENDTFSYQVRIYRFVPEK